jgi:membrane-associated protease RseP (regulator of RpoE activity)
MDDSENPPDQKDSAARKTYLVHIPLFILTFLTTTLAGVQWLNKDPLELSNFSTGLRYAVLIMLMLTSHEFGHYIAARIHGVRATLPFFLPFPSFLGLNPFGTLGAVIRLRSPIPSRRALFDIGVAGPLAGFVVSAVFLVVGLTTLPPREYLYTIHPEYAQLRDIPLAGIIFGDTLFYSLATSLLVPNGTFLPPMNEIYHYPLLCVGWFGMFVTAMNLIPIGQLDGGHISFAMFGNRYHLIAQVSLVVLVVLGLAGFLPILGVDFNFGWTGWLFWAFVLVFFLRMTKFAAPAPADDTPLDPTRRGLGWISAVIFVGSFSITPITLLP